MTTENRIIVLIYVYMKPGNYNNSYLGRPNLKS